MATPQPIVRVSGLGRVFGAKRVFSGIDLELHSGDVLALTGQNGCGKSTLLQILATLLLPTEGDAWIGGHSVTSDAKKARALLGWVPATEGGFAGRLTGAENLRLFGTLRGLDRMEVERRLEPWRSIGTLSQALQTPFHLCSAGMRQALHVARGLLYRPSLLLLDEPTRSLDESSARAVRELLAEARRDSVVVLATHSRDEVRELATRELCLEPRGVAS